jgi:hypothetical protein
MCLDLGHATWVMCHAMDARACDVRRVLSPRPQAGCRVQNGRRCRPKATATCCRLPLSALERRILALGA